jgi:PAS domain S-box-containing protein
MTEGANNLIRLEDELAVRARQQAAVAELGQRALEGADLQSLMDEAVHLVAQTLGVEFCKILELLPDEGTLLLRAGIGWQPGLVGEATIGAGLDSQAGYTLFTRQPVIVEDLRQELRFEGPPLLHNHGVVSGLSVIIQGPRRPFGVLGAHTRLQRTFTTDDVYFLKSIANILAAAIQRKGTEIELQALNASLEQRIIERTGYLRLLHFIGMAANQASSLKPVLQFVLDKVCAFTGWPVGHVYLRVQKPSGRDGPELIPTGLWYLQDPERFASFKDATDQTHLAAGEDLPGQVAARGKPVWIMNITGDPSSLRMSKAAELGMKSGFAFPVLVGEEVAAVIEFFSTRITEPDHSLLDVMAQIGALLGRVVERERAEQELQRREAQLAEAQRMVHLGSWEWDVANNQLEWSDELYRIFGIDPARHIGSYEAFLERVHPQDRELVISEVEKALAEKTPFQFMHRILRENGTERYLYAQGQPVLDETGQLVKLVGTGLDITERRQMEEALRESMSLLEGLFESSPDGTVLATEEGRIVRLNQQMEDLFGYQRDELLGQPLEILLPERYRGTHIGHRLTYNSDARLRPMGAGLELYGLRKDGKEFPVDIMLSPLQTNQGLLTICVVRDVTERKQAAEAVRASEARFRAIFEGAAIGMAVVDLDQRILVGNPRLEEILGYPAEELQGMHQAAIEHPADRALSSENHHELITLNKDHYQMEMRFIRKDRQMIWGNLTVSLVRGPDHRPLFAISMLEDITARKQMEAELAEVQRRLLASREEERVQLAQEIHDVPMQDLYAILYQFNEFDDIAAETPALLDTLNDTRANLQQVINTLRSICGELRPPTLAPFGLEGAIREHAEGFQAKYPEIKVHLNLPYDRKTLSDSTRLNLFRIYQQALNNVARHSKAKNVFIRLLIDEEQVVLEVEDDGAGFEVPRRWIRLAREGHLGLVGSVERAEMIGGKFEVVSSPGQGARVRVEAPLTRDEIMQD